MNDSTKVIEANSYRPTPHSRKVVIRRAVLKRTIRD